MKKILLLLIAAITIGNIHAQRMDDVTVHSKYIQAVDEYRPAPGQYVNEVLVLSIPIWWHLVAGVVISHFTSTILSPTCLANATLPYGETPIKK